MGDEPIDDVDENSVVRHRDVDVSVVDAEQLGDEDVDEGYVEEHVGGRMARLMAAVKVVADEVAGAKEKMNQRDWQRMGVHVPYVHEVTPYGLPCDATLFDVLSADRTVVATELMPTIGATMVAKVLA